MPLTPADVHNVAFKKPPIGKRGYDEEEVDAFLDEVERELARLIEENNDLKGQVERVRASGGPTMTAPTAVTDTESRRLSAENADLKRQLEALRQEKQVAQQAVQQAQQQVVQAREAAQRAQAVSSPPTATMPTAGPTDPADQQQALRVLMLAQRTADDHVADARREADKLLSEARSKADELTREARAKADALERDARQRHSEAMGGLDAKRAALQKHIEELKAFEREYRTRLKAYLESQLRDLDGRAQAMESEVNRPAPAAAGSFSGSFGGARLGSFGQTADGSA
jgi:DivIVA domain-containing protein